MNTTSVFRSWLKSAGSKAVISRKRKRGTKASRKFQNAKSGSVGKENEFLNAGSGGEENKPEFKILEPQMGCRFRQFLVWIMYKTKDMTDTEQKKFIFNKYRKSVKNSMEFMEWLLDEAEFLSYRYQREFTDNVRNGYLVKKKATTDPPSAGWSFNEFLEWVLFEIKGMGYKAKQKFVLKYFPGVPSFRTADFPFWVINETEGMTGEGRRKYVERLRTLPNVSPSYGRIVEAAKGCSYGDFYNWLADNLENENVEAQRFFAEQLPGLPKLLGCLDKSSVMQWVENCTEQLCGMAKRAFALRLRAGPELKMVGGKLENLGRVPEPKEGCSFLEFLGWVISECSYSDCEGKEFLDKKVPGKPIELTTEQFLDWATIKTQGMANEAERQFVKKLRSGPQLIVDADDFVISMEDYRDEEADDYRDRFELYYFKLMFIEAREMDALDWKFLYEQACPMYDDTP